MSTTAKYLYIIFICGIFTTGCNSETKETTTSSESVKSSKFTGNYGKEFNDLHDLHLSAAMKNGIQPMSSKADTSKIEGQMVRMPSEVATFKIDKLKHSIPYLVPKASDLLIDISNNFKDSLMSKNIPLHRLIITSLTRTDEDVKKLTRGNMNASHNSAHCYGTTLDISWKRFEALNPQIEKAVSTDKLKFVLGQVLHDLRERDRCYIKHEKQQACFHITVR